jgi:hypothetical protein
LSVNNVNIEGQSQRSESLRAMVTATCLVAESSVDRFALCSPVKYFMSCARRGKTGEVKSKNNQLLCKAVAMEPWKIVAFHGVIFAVYIFALVYDTIYLSNTPTKQNYAGRFKFLTFWNEVCICKQTGARCMVTV